MHHHPISHAEQDPIAGWLARQYQCAEGGQLPEMIDLFHVNGADNNVRLDRHQISVHTGEAATRMAATLRFRARADAEERGGHERYSVALHWPTDAQAEPMFFTFAVDGMQVRTSQMDTPTEPSNLQGVTKQLMRHNEVLMKVAMGQAERNLELAQRREEMLLGRLQRMEEDRVRVVELQEELMGQHLDRDLLRQRAENNERRKDAALQDVMPLVKTLPAQLVAAVARGGGDNSAATVAMMRSLFENLSLEQLKAMTGQLPPDQQILLLNTYNQVMKLRSADDETGDAAATSDGAATAPGAEKPPH